MTIVAYIIGLFVGVIIGGAAVYVFTHEKRKKQ